jgi:uncharacterized membrane protein YfcA
MTQTDWTFSIYAGAVWGGIFWAVLPIVTSLLEPQPRPPHSVLLTVCVSAVVGIAGFVLFRASHRTTARRVGAAICIGAFIGLPVLAWMALW